MSIVVQLPAEVEHRVRAVAEAEGVDAASVVARLVADAFTRFEDPAPLADPDELRASIAEADAGQTISLEEYAAEVAARFAKAA